MLSTSLTDRWRNKLITGNKSENISDRTNKFKLAILHRIEIEKKTTNVMK